MDDTPCCLACELLHCFSRAEYALKACGFHNIRDEDAKPDWTAFAKNIQKNPDKVEELSKMAEYILNHPPKKQVIRNKQLEWQDSTPETSEIDRMLIYVRRVRNNLFHGGKIRGNI